ncbi:hypothetical protein C8J98_10672 [Luteibacter sp. OK325]|uniref:hypothetical protein n=1 Tax=Luteibacter sp. OK325 TaxID=2135670 RepID=UPI000D399E8A|nr:hypothetical protein [Luteibacter sp. OK325]PTR30761.1 hypothetical protein C8J98_10672 [Luteibacter sp. OK325]
MATNIQERISALKGRRKGADGLAVVAADNVALESYRRKLYLPEIWEGRAGGKPFTQYALGAMQEVDPDYTRISLETADRVANQLGKRVGGFNLDFKLQGSVPLNVHIKGVSDVDLLTTIDGQFLTYDKSGIRSNTYWPSADNSLQQLINLRNEEEPALKKAFPAASVDTSGSKAIKIFGGSLARSVDVVPSHWYDGADYQRTGQLHDRGVIILDRKANQTVTNFPFKHIKLVSDQDAIAVGGLKKAIRLCKNVKADSGRDIALPSFDIAAIMFHADLAALRMGVFHELAILAETQRYLDYLYYHPNEAQRLYVPDGTRRIFDTEAKVSALLALSSEMDELSKAVAAEFRLLGPIPTSDSARQILKEVRVP